MPRDEASDRIGPDVRLVHFVGFRDERYLNAVRIFGEPDMVHEAWDRYAADDVAPGDIVVFADGEWDQQPRSFTVEAEMKRRERKTGNRSRSIL